MMQPSSIASPSSSSSSSDEEDESKPLQKSPSPPQRRRSTFQISSSSFNNLPRSVLSVNKKLILAVILPLIIVIAFFSIDFRRLPSVIPIVPSVSPADRMRQSELQALSLLHDHQKSLSFLFNRSVSISNLSAATPLEDFRYTLMQQIKLNQQIQDALLSAHRTGNSTDSPFDAFDGSVGSQMAVDTCRKLDVGSQRRTIEWKPKGDRFLFAVCTSGQMSNHLICLEKHMFFAALLGRMLVLPSPKFDYHYDRVLDVGHINECFERKVVMEFNEFATMKKNHVHINRLICYMASPPCFLDEEHIKKLKDIGVSVGKVEAAWPEAANSKEPKKRTVNDVLPKFSTDDEVIAIGDVFYAAVEEEWVMQPGGPLAHKCKTVLQPSRLILVTAQRFIQTFLGSNYIALHFRRHGFLKFCNVKKESCFFPIPQAAQCILRVVQRSNAPVIYLSTDAAESERDLLRSLVVLNDRAVPLIRRPGHNWVEKWDTLLYRKGLGGDNQVEAMLDKTICAMSRVFIGSSGSTFTDDIFRLRRGWQSASICDENLCQGELPNFIAEEE